MTTQFRIDTRFFPSELLEAARLLLPAASEALTAIREKRCVGAEWTGWFDWPARAGHDLVREVMRFKDDLDCHYDLVLVVGIGGSYLGTRAVADALSHTHAGLVGRARDGGRPLITYAGHHLSEAGLVETLDLLEERQPIVNVISKSGTTTEPGVAFRVVREYMERRFGKKAAARRIIATTDAHKGALRQLATEKGYKTFVVPDDVGGRFSVLTAVGLVPLALAGFAIDRLMAGADRVFGELKGSVAEHPALVYAACRKAAFDAGKRLEILAYGEPKLASIVEWWKQLFGESEGKAGKGLFPAGMAYTTDLHSLGQYVQDGARTMIETFLMTPATGERDQAGIERRLRVPAGEDDADGLRFVEGRLVEEINRAALMGTQVAHFDGGVPCLSLSTPALDEAGLGALFAFFETACGVSGALLGVNPYDQPGVEAYKKNLFGLLGKPGFEQLGKDLMERL